MTTALNPHLLTCLAQSDSFDVRQPPPCEMMTVEEGALALDSETEKGSRSPFVFVICALADDAANAASKRVELTLTSFFIMIAFMPVIGTLC